MLADERPLGDGAIGQVRADQERGDARGVVHLEAEADGHTAQEPVQDPTILDGFDHEVERQQRGYGRLHVVEARAAEVDMPGGDRHERGC